MPQDRPQSPAPPYWPLFDLVLVTDRLVMRPPADDDFPGLLEAVDAGIHDPAEMPFSMPWTDAPRASRALGSVQHWWSRRAGWSVEEWHLPFAVFLDGDGRSGGRAVGVQEVFAMKFPILKEVGTGSWLTRSAQGQGIGKEMRAAVLQLAFEGLSAGVARSGAFEDNPASIAVSRALGYRENGRRREAPRGTPKTMIDFELTREEWLARRDSQPRATITGLDSCLDMFGS